MIGHSLHIIMPVKDSLETTREAIETLYESGRKDWTFTLYNDFSTPENTAVLNQWAEEFGFQIVHWQDRTDHPSPNYRLTLIDAQKEALARNAHLLIIESDVCICPNTIEHLLLHAEDEDTAMIGAITTDEDGFINFPYLYAKRWPHEVITTNKRLSFCCTILTHELMQQVDFATLDETKDWFDVTLSHMARALGMKNLLCLDTPVLHRPHSSRPWKKEKQENILLYYWHKLMHGRDKI